jgi:hypothetical protein
MDCPACGTTNPVAARYCLECSAALSGERSPGTRKTLTVLCCDVVGSTALGEAHDPELVRAVMTRYYAAIRAAIEAHGGRLERFTGDAVLAVFGIPTAHEDDALRAARAALAMQAAVGPLNAMLAVERSVTIAIRTGITSGEVMVGEAMTGGPTPPAMPSTPRPDSRPWPARVRCCLKPPRWPSSAKPWTASRSPTSARRARPRCWQPGGSGV